MRWLRRLAIAVAALALLLAVGIWWLGWGRHAGVFAPPAAETARAARVGLGLPASAAAAQEAAGPATVKPPPERLHWEEIALRDPQAEFLQKAGACLDAALAGDAEGAWCLQELKGDCTVRELQAGEQPQQKLEALITENADKPVLVDFYSAMLERCRRYWQLPPDRTLTERQRIELLLNKGHPLASLASVFGQLPVKTDRETRAILVERAWQSGDVRAMIQIDHRGRAVIEQAGQANGGQGSAPLDQNTMSLVYALLACRMQSSCDQPSREFEAYCNYLSRSFGATCPVSTSIEHLLRLQSSPAEFRLAEAAAREMQPHFESRDPSWPPLLALTNYLRTHDDTHAGDD